MDDFCDGMDLYARNAVQELELVIYNLHSNLDNTLPALTCWQIMDARAR